jgi:hypothetical protein
MKRSILFFACALAALASCVSKDEALEDPPIITSATYQHALYNGRGQPIEARAASDKAPPLVVTYFTSEENLLRDIGGSAEAPSAVGDYFVRIRRPVGKGYRKGPDIKVEYHIQKALVAISAAERQEYPYDGKPKSAAASAVQPVELRFSYYPLAENSAPLPGPPTERGHYRVRVFYPGGPNYMGASKDVELVIR